MKNFLSLWIFLGVLFFGRAGDVDTRSPEPPPTSEPDDETAAPYSTTDVTASTTEAAAVKPPPIWVPNEFPRGDVYNGTKILEGDLEKLTRPTDDVRKPTFGVELSDLLRDDRKKNESVTLSATYPTVVFPDPINDDTEQIENGENTEDKRRIKNKAELEEFKTLVAADPMEKGGWLAGMLVAFLVVGSAVAYLGLLSWRRYLEYKYGSRQILVNEEDFEDPNDMRHFSI